MKDLTIYHNPRCSKSRQTLQIIKDHGIQPIVVEYLKVPLKKVAIELNNEIIDKKKINKIYLKKNDKIEIVHFIGGGWFWVKID